MNFLLHKLHYKFVCRANQARAIFWSRVFKKTGAGLRVLGRITCIHPENISVGNQSSINEGCILNARASITIGDNVHISSYAVLNTAGLDYESPGRPHFAKPIIIHNAVWIGSGVIINPGVTIGENSIVGAGAVVTKDIPRNVVAVGVPAKVVKEIDIK